MDRETAMDGKKRARQPGRGVLLCHLVALAGASMVLWLTWSLDTWQLSPLLLLAGFMSVSILMDVATGAGKVRISGVLIGLLVTVVLLGPGPAAVLGATTMVISWPRTRASWH